MDIAHYLSQRDAQLGEVIPFLELPALETEGDLFYDLVSCIVGQQIHYRRKVPAFHKLLRHLPEHYPRPDTIAQLSESAFADLKISANKYATLLRLSELWEVRQLATEDWSQWSAAELRALLSEIKGIGPLTIDMVLMYSLGAADVFPAGDYHLKQIMTRVYGLQPKSRLKAQMETIAAAWRPYRSWGVRYWWEWKKQGAAR
ncbi:MAG: hypothetical protein AAFR05_21890 [Bacteroidota bacterium]